MELYHIRFIVRHGGFTERTWHRMLQMRWQVGACLVWHRTSYCAGEKRACLLGLAVTEGRPRGRGDDKLWLLVYRWQMGLESSRE